MGPPRTRAQHFLAQRGRFQEGSMSDRVSAVPPVHFLGPQEREALERPVSAESAAPFAAFEPAYLGRRAAAPQMCPPPARKATARMNIFGQVWEGVRGRLRLRRDAEDREKGRREGRKDAASSDAQDDRPSRDDVFASYQQLVASGFFSSHAVQSTRHGPPPNCRPSTSHGAPVRNAGHAPQWPLAPRPLTPQAQARAQAVCSPVSVASSRGTKRAAESPVPSVHGDGEGEEQGEGEGEGEEEEGEDESTLAHRFLPKRLRIAAARDISLPKLRSVASRKNMRAAVASARRNVSVGTQEGDGKEREPNKLTKRVFWAPQQQQQQQQQKQGGVPVVRASLDVLPPGRNSSEIHGSVTRRIRRPTSARNLRSAGMRDGDGGLKVVPDVNRGIPRVPDIPVKFTYGQDRENGVPWRGLRR